MVNKFLAYFLPYALCTVVILFTSRTLHTQTTVRVSNDTNRMRLLFEKSMNGTYPGDNRRKLGTDLPVYTQRTAFLYYSREIVGESMVWSTLALGTVGNLKELVSDKKISMLMWKDINPEKFKTLQKHLPTSWSDFDRDVILDQVDPEKIYVFKPSNGADGEGIAFKTGKTLGEVIPNNKKDEWVVQSFVSPFLFDGKKTHFRTLSLAVMRPNGDREFYMYSQMKMLTAPVEYQESLLFDDDFMDNEESKNMLITNLRLSREMYHRDISNKGKVFEPWSVVLDVEESVGKEVYDGFFQKTMEVHSIIYDIIGDSFVCKPTEISLYGNGCFHILASDIAISDDGKPVFLEINAAMGMKGLWKTDEIHEFADGAAAILEVENSPYKGEYTDKWVKM